MKAGKVVDQEKLFEDIGRMRSIEEGNDGFIYIGLENPGRVVRLRPFGKKDSISLEHCQQLIRLRVLGAVKPDVGCYHITYS